MIAVGKREMGGLERFWKDDNNNKDKCLMSSYYVPDPVVSTFCVYLVSSLNKTYEVVFIIPIL